MPRYKLTIAYDGTEFCGWQRQYVGARPIISGDLSAPEAPGAVDKERAQLRTVQQVVEEAVRKVVREPVSVMGASRTDSGVHALGQVAAFTCSGDMPTGGTLGEGLPAEPDARRLGGWPVSRGVDRLQHAINARLPPDVLIIACEPVHATFDPIGDARTKQYAYRLYISEHRPLWERHRVHHVWAGLDVPAMQAAARVLVGEHDFAAFAAAGHGRLTTVRTIHRCDVEEVRPRGRTESGTQCEIVIRVAGSGFLWHMVRIIAGTLFEAGRGRIGPLQIAEALQTGDRRLAGPTLPARGLCLEWIRYNEAEPATGSSD